MASNASAARKPGQSTNRNAQNATLKEANPLTMEDIGPIMQPSQSNSDDGMMATIAQQMQAYTEKKKEKEAKLLQAVQVELTKTFVEKARDLADGVAEIEKNYSAFQDAYAANEDNIRKLWDAILKEQLKLQAFVEERHKLTLKREKRREKEHIQALALCRKACEESHRLINSLEPNYEHA